MHAHLRPTIAALLLATGLAAGLLVVPGISSPQVAMACSCVAPVSLAEYAGEGVVIFAGTITSSDEDGLLVTVDQWFSGAGAAPVILINGEFGSSAACGLDGQPPAGTSWLVVGGRASDGGIVPELMGVPVSVNICRPFVNLATPEGQALLDEANSTFGGEPAPIPTPASAETPSSPTSPGTPPDAEGPSTETLVAIGIAVTLLAGAAVLVLALLLARRQDPASRA